MSTAIHAFEGRAVASLASLYAFRMLGLFMVLPVLALYGDDYSGSTPLLLGWALGAYGLSQAVLQVPFGWLSDHFGRKKVIACGLLIFAAGSVVCAMADSVYELILGRALQGAGAIASAVMALVADLTSEENRTKAMGVIGISIGVTFSLALVLGPLLSAWGGMSAIFWLTVALAILGLGLLKIIPTPHQGASHRDTLAVPAEIKGCLQKPALLRLNFGVFVLHFVLMASFIVLPEILERELEIARAQHWLVYLPILVLAFAAMIPAIIYGETRRQMKRVFVAAIIILAMMELVLLQWATHFWPCIVALFFFFVAFNLLEASLPSLVSKIAPAGNKGTAAGIYSTCQFLGAFGGGVLGGWLLESGGLSDVFLACSIMMMLWALVALTMDEPPYLSSVLVAVDGDWDEAELRLRALVGVDDVVVIEEERVAYLKVDRRVFDPDSVKAID